MFVLLQDEATDAGAGTDAAVEEGAAAVINLTSRDMGAAGILILIGVIVFAALIVRIWGGDTDKDGLQLRWGAIVGFVGLTVALSSLVLALGTLETSTGVVAVVGVVTGIVGTIVGAFFGVEAAAKSADDSAKTARELITTVNTSVAALDRSVTSMAEARGRPPGS
ncbi:hypothetical protein BH24CHL4_BH24CHL4_10040 [soil metagenome]